MGKTGCTGRLLGIWKPKPVMPRNKTKPYRRAIAGRITSQGSFDGDSPLLRQNRGRMGFRQHLSWPSSPELLCLGRTICVSFSSRTCHLSEMSWNSAAPYDLHHLCCRWWHVTSVMLGGSRRGSARPSSLSELNCIVTHACLLWVCSQAFRVCYEFLSPQF